MLRRFKTLVSVFLMSVSTPLVLAAASSPEYPEGTTTPRGLTADEKAYLDQHPLSVPVQRSNPPSGPIHCPAEYEPMSAIIMAWESWSTESRNIHLQMADAITTVGNADVYIVVDTASEQASANNYLVAYGVDVSRVHYVIRTTDTIWIRDYGPRYIYEGDCRAIIDHTYNRPRYNDNDFPEGFSQFMNHAIYEIPLIHGGGNFHIDAPGGGYATRLIVNENPSLAEQQILDFWHEYQNLDVTLFTPFPTSVDSTQHIDMWMQLIDDDAVIISDWPHNSGSTQDVICDNAAVWFANRGYSVHRPPARNYLGTHYTYTNVVMCNDLVLIPTYTAAGVSSYNGLALSTWQNALPDKTIVQVNCDAIVGSAGVMHCIAMHVPVHRGGINPTIYLKNLRGGDVLDAGNTIDIRWISDDDEGVANVDILLSTDGGLTFPHSIASGTTDDGVFSWTVPAIDTAHAQIRIIARDYDGNTGSNQSDTDFIMGMPPFDANRDGAINIEDYSVFIECLDGPENYPAPSPPATAETCLKVFDADTDDDVDLVDFMLFSTAFDLP